MIKTTWGYNLTEANSLTDFLTLSEFCAFTNGKFSINDSRIKENIPAATRAIQNYCGWHIFPNLECEMVYRLFDLRDSFIGRDLLIQLPATFVTEVKEVLLNAKNVGSIWVGEPTTDYDLDESGLLRVYDIGYYDRKTKLRIVYDAGVGADQMSLVKELVANSVTHSISTTYGIASETAGSVSVSYSANWAGSSRSTALADDTKEILNPFRIKGVY